MSDRGVPDRLVVGHVSKPHGTKGEVFVWPLTDRPDTVFAEGRVLDIADAGEGGRQIEGRGGSVGSSLQDLHGDAGGAGFGGAPGQLTIERTRPFKRGLLVKVDGLNDRSAVEPLAGRYLLAPIESLDALEEDEVFYHQLLDAEVVTIGGERVGTVREVYETEPAHLLEVKSDAGALHLVPFSKRIVKSVDTEVGRIVIDPPPGLLEL